jgi:hypothetical protein
MTYETNVFPITNLQELSARYRLYEIAGLNRSLDEYESNIQVLIRKLSFFLKNPVTVINRYTDPRLVIRDHEDSIKRVPTEFGLIRNSVFLRPTTDSFNLDYLNYTDDTREVCLRFLNFDLQNHLKSYSELWQPGAGRPFYFKRAQLRGLIGVHDGFISRVVELPTKGFGILVESTKRFVQGRPLDNYLNRDSFRQFKNKHFVYHFGHQWYEIKAEEISDLNVSQYKYPRDGNQVILIEDLRTQTSRPHPKELADLPNDSSVILYRDTQGNLKAAPSGLSYLILDSEETGMHDLSILEPSKRRSEINQIRGRFLSKVIFGKNTLLTDLTPLAVDRRVFPVPDYEFGNGNLLSVNGTPGCRSTTIEQLGRTRKSLLLDSAVGFYSRGPWDRQYFIMPKSVEDSMGKLFLEDLKVVVNRMYPRSDGYNPSVISYDDRISSNYIEKGYEIIKTIKEAAQGAGYCVVMIPGYEGRKKRRHDELAALIIQQLQEQEIYASVIHTDTVRDSYYLSKHNGKPQYRIKDDRSAKLRGYINNVAINKVLLTNNKWPFVLNTPLFADVTIGIDVKNHMAGFTLVDKLGKKIRKETQPTKQKEKLTSHLIYSLLKRLIVAEASSAKDLFKYLVFHRDGKLFDTERDGILMLISDLKKEGIISNEAEIAIVEIAKHTSTTLRLFDIGQSDQQAGLVQNPAIGSYVIMNRQEAYLCSTGKEFRHKGTTSPLLVRYDFGALEFEIVLKDLYQLTALSYTRPEDCSRHPITIKLTDRRLEEVASEYDSETFDLVEQISADKS